MTTQWRARQITEAGGSVELARQKFAAEGLNFEEAVRERYRFHITQVYFQKKLMPRIQVTADDMRRYYQLNKDKEFTDHDAARFRLIKIDPKLIGGADAKDKAVERARELRARATKGQEDFAELAKFSHDAHLSKTGGDVGWVQRGAYSLEKVEKAVFALQPGQVTDIIVEGGAFYIAKLEELKNGFVNPFNSQAVQTEIHDKLQRMQFRTMREAQQADLERGAIINFDPQRMDVALEMAMQRYPQWAAAGAGAGGAAPPK
jgi:peptidyl-prolyl cis-trans isomerase D